MTDPEDLDARVAAAMEALGELLGPDVSFNLHVCGGGHVTGGQRDGESAPESSRLASAAIADAIQPRPDRPTDEQLRVVLKLAAARLGEQRACVVVAIDARDVLMQVYCGEEAAPHVRGSSELVSRAVLAVCRPAKRCPRCHPRSGKH